MSEERAKRPRGRRPKKKVCQFCVDKVEHIDYKDTMRLRRYATGGARSCPDVCPATAPSISASCPWRSSARASSRCCPSPPTEEQRNQMKVVMFCRITTFYFINTLSIT